LKRIKKIQKLYKNHEDSAVNDYIRQQKSYDDQLHLLTELQNYTQQYVSTFSLSASNGVSIEILKNYNNFMDRLNQIVKKQQNIVEQEFDKLDSARAEWQINRMKRTGIDKLCEKRMRQTDRRLNHLEQKSLDEIVLQRYLPRND